MSKPYYEKTFDRHKQDLLDVKNGVRDDIRFNDELGFWYVEIIENLKHFEGELTGQRIILEDWQIKAIIICFGWQRKRIDENGNYIIRDGETQWVRRFNTAFWFLPRKNGKSIIASGLCIAEANLSVEDGNQVVSFATKREQAKIVYNGCKKMLENTTLPIEYREAYSTLEMLQNDVSITTLSKDSRSQDGLSVGFGVGDEVHAFQDREQIDVIQSSQGARVQPMMFYITTAGADVSSPGAVEYEYAKKVMDGAIDDDTYFAFICELDKDDDPFDEAVWHKANPNLGISKTWDYMRRQAKQAKQRTEAKNNFLIKDLNKWTNATENFVEFNQWVACGRDNFDTNNAEAVFIGVDLSRSDDFTAVNKTYMMPDGVFYTTQHYYIPKDRIPQRESELRIPLTKWVLEGYITATPGATIDLDYIAGDLLTQIDEGIDEICYDPYRAATLIAKVESESGFENCVQIRQGYLTISEPTFNFRDYVRTQTLLHDNNPVTKWMVSNLSVITDSAGNIKPDKTKPNRKIDGCAAIINTLARSIAYEKEPESVYESRGVRTV